MSSFRGAAQSESIKEQIIYHKAFRELISYRAPSSGGDLVKDEFVVKYDIICKIFVELAQLLSEIFEKSLMKHLSKVSQIEKQNISLNMKTLESAFLTEVEGIKFLDQEDKYRIGYFKRKYPLPANILHMMSEGHIEDFFGSWEQQFDSIEEEEMSDVFDPDEYSVGLFQFH
jgi:hypothetical protein